MLNRAQIRPAAAEYRDWGGGIFMTALCACCAAAVGFKVVDAMGFFDDSPLTHLSFIMRELLGFQSAAGYLHWLMQRPLQAAIYYGLPLTAAGMAGWWAWSWFGRKINPIIHIGGRRLLTGAKAAASSRRATEREVRASGAGLKIHPDLQLARHQELTSFLFLAGQRGGKTQVLSRVLQQSWARGDKTISFDFKTDFTVITPPTINGVEPLIFGPWENRTTVWDIAADVSELHHAKAFASGIVPANDRDPMWSNAARALLVAILMKQITLHGRGWGWKELGDDAFLTVSELKVVADQFYPPAVAIVADAESKTAGSVMINLHAFLGPLFDLKNAWGGAPAHRKLSLDEWLKDDNTKFRNLIIQGNTQHHELSQALIKSMIETMVSILASPAFPQSRDRRIIFTMDEFIQFGKIDSIQIIPELLASRGCVLIVTIQSIAQVEQKYGREIAAIFASVFQTKIFGRIVGSSDLKWVQEQVGRRVVGIPTRSTSGSGDGRVNINQSYQRDEIEVVRAEDLESLGMVSRGAVGKQSDPSDIYIRALVLGHGGDALVLEWPLWRHTKYRKDHIPRRIHPRPQPQPAPMSNTGTDTDSEDLHLAQVQTEELVSVAQKPNDLEFADQLSMPSTDAPPQISEDKHIGGAAEVVHEIAKNQVVDALADSLGINSEALELAIDVLELTEPEHTESGQQYAIVSPQKRKKKVRQYESV
jgi:lambda repressor-like predicted transcriptional regulator